MQSLLYGLGLPDAGNACEVCCMVWDSLMQEMLLYGLSMIQEVLAMAAVWFVHDPGNTCNGCCMVCPSSRKYLQWLLYGLGLLDQGNA
jgi:hypothetical protein